MTWDDYRAARQLLVEEQIGRRVREVRRQEDAAFEKAREGHERLERRRR